MRQKPAGRSSSSAHIIKDIKRRRVSNTMRKRKFASCLTVYVAKTASPSCADEKASPSVFITKGSKDFMAAGKKRLERLSPNTPWNCVD